MMLKQKMNNLLKCDFGGLKTPNDEPFKTARDQPFNNCVTSSDLIEQYAQLKRSLSQLSCNENAIQTARDKAGGNKIVGGLGSKALGLNFGSKVDSVRCTALVTPREGTSKNLSNTISSMTKTAVSPSERNLNILNNKAVNPNISSNLGNSSNNLGKTAYDKRPSVSNAFGTGVQGVKTGNYMGKKVSPDKLSPTTTRSNIQNQNIQPTFGSKVMKTLSKASNSILNSSKQCSNQLPSPRTGTSSLGPMSNTNTGGFASPREGNSNATSGLLGNSANKNTSKKAGSNAPPKELQGSLANLKYQFGSILNEELAGGSTTRRSGRNSLLDSNNVLNTINSNQFGNSETPNHQTNVPGQFINAMISPRHTNRIGTTNTANTSSGSSLYGKEKLKGLLMNNQEETVIANVNTSKDPNSNYPSDSYLPLSRNEDKWKEIFAQKDKEPEVSPLDAPSLTKNFVYSLSPKTSVAPLARSAGSFKENVDYPRMMKQICKRTTAVLESYREKENKWNQEKTQYKRQIEDLQNQVEVYENLLRKYAPIKPAVNKLCMD